MGLFQKLFGGKRPILNKSDVSDVEKVAQYVAWFAKNDNLIKSFLGRSSYLIFDEGYRPITGSDNDPEAHYSDIENLADWFVLKMYIDLNKTLKDCDKEEFAMFIDMLVHRSNETLSEAGEIAIKYNMNLERYIYEKEIAKIPNEKESSWFKLNYLSDNVLSAEGRILAWLYKEYYGEWYQPSKGTR